MSEMINRERSSLQWHPLCPLGDIPILGARVLKRPNQIDIAIFRTADDKVFALNDECPHKKGPLSQGIVFGEKVACPLHNWTIGLQDGCALAPDQGCTVAHPTNVVDGQVLIGL